jgi:uncharacterized OB-fold protein
MPGVGVSCCRKSSDSKGGGLVEVGEPVEDGLFTSAGLIGGECAACRQRHFPRADTCPWCGTPDVSEVTLSTEGRLWAWTAVNTPPPGYEGAVPYGFGVVELDHDNLQVVTRLVEADPSALQAGTALRFTVVPLDGETTTWAYGPS